MMKSVLLVENEALIAMLFEDALSEAGYAVTCALNSADAFHHLDAPNNIFHALIADIHLPGVVSGWDVAHKMRQRNPEAAIFYMTGDPEVRPEERASGQAALFYKPVSVDEIMVQLDRVLNRSAPEWRT